MKGIIFDLDGTLVRGDEAIPGAVDAVIAIRRRGLRIAFCTQDSLHTPAATADKLARLGFEATVDEVVTAGSVAVDYLASRRREASLYLIGAPELREALRRKGIEIVSDAEAPTASTVLIGRDPRFTAEHVTLAYAAVRNGAAFFGVGNDRVIPVAGRNLPAIGAVIKAIEFVTNRRAKILGKPSREFARVALQRLRAEPRDIAVVGDHVDADISMGKSIGARTVLVLSGGTSAARASRIPARLRPDAVMENVAALPQWIARERKRA